VKAPTRPVLRYHGGKNKGFRARIIVARIARAAFFWAFRRFSLRRNLRMLAIEHAERYYRVFYMRAVFGRRVWDEAVARHEADITAYRAGRDRA